MKDVENRRVAWCVHILERAKGRRKSTGRTEAFKNGRKKAVWAWPVSSAPYTLVMKFFYTWGKCIALFNFLHTVQLAVDMSTRSHLLKHIGHPPGEVAVLGVQILSLKTLKNKLLLWAGGKWKLDLQEGTLKVHRRWQESALKEKRIIIKGWILHCGKYWWLSYIYDYKQFL